MDAQTGLHVFSTRASYPLTGSTLRELRGLIGVLGPTRGGRSYGGFTDWRIDWWFDVEAEQAAARVAGVRVEVRTHTLLPRWRPPGSAPETLRAEWGRYLAALETHERGHVNLAVEAGRNMLARLERLAGFGGLDALQEAAKDTAASVLASAHEQERAYDIGSEHGALQGARLAESPAA